MDRIVTIEGRKDEVGKIGSRASKKANMGRCTGLTSSLPNKNQSNPLNIAPALVKKVTFHGSFLHYLDLSHSGLLTG